MRLRDDTSIAYVQVTVKLGLEGDRLDPDAAVLLGVPPDAVGRAGDVRPGGRVRRMGFCEWGAGPQSTYEWEPLLVGLLDRLRPLDRLRDVARQFHADVYAIVVSRIYGDLSPDGTSFESTAPAHHLDAAVIADLAALGAALDIDEYVHVDERPDHERPEDERLAAWGWEQCNGG